MIADDFADPKNKRYRLSTKKEVRAAARFFADRKNRKAYSKEDQTIIMDNIRSAEKKFKIGTSAESK